MWKRWSWLRAKEYRVAACRHAGEPQRDAALAFLDNLLREGEQPAGIVGALAWMYRKLIEARGSAGAYEPVIRRRGSLGMRPEAAEAAVRQAHRIPKKELLAGLVALAEADSQLKSSNPDPRAFMEFLVARLTAPRFGGLRRAICTKLLPAETSPPGRKRQLDRTDRQSPSEPASESNTRAQDSETRMPDVGNCFSVLVTCARNVPAFRHRPKRRDRSQRRAVYFFALIAFRASVRRDL